MNDSQIDIREVYVKRIRDQNKDDVALVKINLTWKSGKLDRKRDMQTFVSRYGLQNYIY